MSHTPKKQNYEEITYSDNNSDSIIMMIIFIIIYLYNSDIRNWYILYTPLAIIHTFEFADIMYRIKIPNLL